MGNSLLKLWPSWSCDATPSEKWAGDVRWQDLKELTGACEHLMREKMALWGRILCLWACDGREQRPEGRGGEDGLSVFLEEIRKLKDGDKAASRRMGEFEG